MLNENARKRLLALVGAGMLLSLVAGCGSEPPPEFLDSRLYVVNDSGVRSWEDSGITVRTFCRAFTTGCSWRERTDGTAKGGTREFIATGRGGRDNLSVSVRLIGDPSKGKIGASEMIFDGEVVPWGVLYTVMPDLIARAKQAQ